MSGLPWRVIGELPRGAVGMFLFARVSYADVITRTMVAQWRVFGGSGDWSEYHCGDGITDYDIRQSFTHFIEITPP